jgi:hypothetical protein
VAPSIKNSKNNGLINPSNWNNRVPSTTDQANSFYARYDDSFHGTLFLNGNYLDVNGAPQTIAGGSYTSPILRTGCYTEIALQSIGSGLAITVYGTIFNDPSNAAFVAANVVTGSDGIIRVLSLYRFIYVVVTGATSSNGLYLQIW